MSDKRPIIIKKIKKVQGGGHHGGAWKVAYADFVTAMMAFFLLLWLITAVPTDKLSGLADYFTPTAGVKGKVGDSGRGGQGRSENGLLQDGGETPSVVYGAPDNFGPITKAPETQKEQEAEYEGSEFDEIPEYEAPVAQQGNVQINDASPEALEIARSDAETIEEELEKLRFEEIAKALQDKIKEDPDLAAFAENIKIDQTEEGLRIQITDVEGNSMFEIGSTKLRIESEPVLAQVSEVMQSVDNKVSIIGHTDSYTFGSNAEYTNWELSSDRANASRRFLIEAGLDAKRIHKVEGMADRSHYIEDDPYSPENRRISIILIKKSLVPPSEE